MSTVSIGAWMRVPKSHPMARTMCQAMVAPNPTYASLVRGGRPIPDGVTEMDQLWKDKGDFVLIPRAYGERMIPVSPEQYNVVDAPVAYPKFTLALREGQPEFADAIVEYLQGASGCVAQAKTGFGKTIVTGAVLFHLKQRALILVHTEFLMRQWEERLQQCGLKEQQIGRVHQNRMEWGGQYVVSIAMIQTLLARRKTYPKKFFRGFGIVVCDEVHNMGAATFRKTITMFNPRWRLGLSATPERKDGCEKVFTAHIGRIAVVSRKKSLLPRIQLVFHPHELDESALKAPKLVRARGSKKRYWRKEDSMTAIESFLVNHQQRNTRIVRLLVRAAKANRRVLVLTSRRAHLLTLKRLTEAALKKIGNASRVGLLHGQMKPDVWAANAGCPLIVATYHIAKEALDMPQLDVLILATPRADVVQAVGRVLREVKGKRQPIVIDFIDEGIKLCEGLAQARWRQYRAERWVHGDIPRISPSAQMRKQAVGWGRFPGTRR